MSISFTKMHGLGNDFVIIDQRDGSESLTPVRIREISDRKRGVGCDQIIHIKPPLDGGADVFLDMYNQDGSPLEACGNATRCVASLIMNELGKDEVVIQTVAGFLTCCAANKDRSLITADMGVPVWDWRAIPLAKERDTLNLELDMGAVKNPVAVSMGNPHCVFFTDDVESLNIKDIGPLVENHALFPKRTNVEFVEVRSRSEVRMRVWERGTGVTQACGSGACATVAAAVRRGLTDRKVSVILDGGILHFDWRTEDDHMLMTGPATYVFEGILKGR